VGPQAAAAQALVPAHLLPFYPQVDLVQKLWLQQGVPLRHCSTPGRLTATAASISAPAASPCTCRRGASSPGVGNLLTWAVRPAVPTRVDLHPQPRCGHSSRLLPRLTPVLLLLLLLPLLPLLLRLRLRRARLGARARAVAARAVTGAARPFGLWGAPARAARSRGHAAPLAIGGKEVDRARPQAAAVERSGRRRRF
jgi:hypothetical protein